MTKAEYDRKVLSLKGTHDYDMLCFIMGQYIASLEAENANLNDWLTSWKESLTIAQAEIAKLQADNRSLVEQMNAMAMKQNQED